MKANQKPAGKGNGMDGDVGSRKCGHNRKRNFSPTLCEIINGGCDGCSYLVDNFNKKNTMKLKIEEYLSLFREYLSLFREYLSLFREKSSLFWIMLIGIGGFIALFICGYCV